MVLSRGRARPLHPPDAPTPPGAPAPRGSVLTIVIDAHHGTVTDAGLSNRYPDVGALGAVRTLYARFVTEPRLVGQSLDVAYARLRKAGMRVSFGTAAADSCPPTISAENPAAATRVRAGTTTTLTPNRVSCGAGSPAIPVGALPSATVPQFRGRLLTAAIDWAQTHRLSWDAGALPPLTKANAPTLLGNYRIISQHPAPGATLTLGIGHTNGTERSWQPTPLVLRCRQR